MSPGERPETATVGELVRAVQRFLAGRFAGEARADSAGLDARLIVAEAAGLLRAELPLKATESAGSAVVDQAWELAERRVRGEPVARLIGRKEFWSLDLIVSPAVLVPRPDTETLVSAAFDWADRSGRRDDPLRLLDLGTGSGAILLALLSELRGAVGTGTDRDHEALEVARENADLLGFGERAGFLLSDWGKAVEGQYDAVLANPPYIESAVIGTLDAEVRDHDPLLALDGGPDGLDAYRAIVPELARLVAPRGAVLFEVGAGQAGAVAKLLKEAGFEVELHRDLSGIERVVEGTRA